MVSCRYLHCKDELFLLLYLTKGNNVLAKYFLLMNPSWSLEKCGCIKFLQAHRRGGSKGSNELPLEVNNGGLKTQTVNFQLLANTGGMENKLRALQLLNYPARRH